MTQVSDQPFFIRAYATHPTLYLTGLGLSLAATVGLMSLMEPYSASVAARMLAAFGIVLWAFDAIPMVEHARAKGSGGRSMRWVAIGTNGWYFAGFMALAMWNGPAPAIAFLVGPLLGGLLFGLMMTSTWFNPGREHLPTERLDIARPVTRSRWGRWLFYLWPLVPIPAIGLIMVRGGEVADPGLILFFMLVWPYVITLYPPGPHSTLQAGRLAGLLLLGTGLLLL